MGLEQKDSNKPKDKQKKIVFDLKEFNDWIETLGCDCCLQGWLHFVGSNLILDWESNINGVITKHKDVELKGEIIE